MQVFPTRSRAFGFWYGILTMPFMLLLICSMIFNHLLSTRTNFVAGSDAALLASCLSSAITYTSAFALALALAMGSWCARNAKVITETASVGE
jgi:hypothetical protein